METIEIRQIRYLAPDAQLLVKAALAELAERYEDDEGDATPLEPAEFDRPYGAFFVLYLDGEPVACGAWRGHGEDAEIKRMYTTPAARGRGLARAILAAVEKSAREHGRRRMILETGVQNHEAVKMYESAGYQRIQNFGYYRDEPGCLSYALDL